MVVFPDPSSPRTKILFSIRQREPKTPPIIHQDPTRFIVRFIVSLLWGGGGDEEKESCDVSGGNKRILLGREREMARENKTKNERIF